ncbi:MAG: RNA polymerase sigma factor, partial [Actinomycetota bacterium]|nr:RNA polymerase sigma factor [Actinomycetota bacterium]
MSKVSPAKQDPPTTLPKEFSNPGLQRLLAAGSTRGSVDGQELRSVVEDAKITPARMKVVLRTLDDMGISVTLQEERRAVAATATKRTATAPAKRAVAKKTTAKAAASATDAAPAKKATATKTTAKATIKKAAAAPSASDDSAPAPS